MPSFSALDRTHHLHQLQSHHWDLLIIGGGITGAGILLDAVSRGLSAALIEKADFASGTSSKSTKLIHGGLRYLKQFEIGLVREVGKERATVYRNARHIVRPEPMLLPLYKGGSIGRYSGALGLWFYDFLAGVDDAEKRRMLSAKETIEAEPLLRHEDLTGGGLYYEYRTDDARLTIEVLKKAVELGGLALNYCNAVEIMHHEGRVSGITCHDALNGSSCEVHARHVINAAGPWVDDVRKMDDAEHADQKLLLTKGVHIVVGRDRLPLRQSLYFDVESDDRMIFCIPRDNTVYIGTTDTVHDASPDNIKATAEDITYLLGAVNALMPSVKLISADILSTWSGVRPLIYEEGKSPSELSRKDEIFQSASGLISIAGGKLTGYRKMAERIVDLIASGQSSKTQDCQLVGGSFTSEEDVHNHLMELCNEFSQVPQEDIGRLFFRYGNETRDILSIANARSAHAISADDLIASETRHAILSEMTHRLTDFALLRTGALYFDQDWLILHRRAMVTAMSKLLKWDQVEVDRQQEALDRLLEAPDFIARES